jgi:DNA-binding transcriptional regulator YiaG
MELSLKEKFARLGPTLAIDPVQSGSPEVLVLTRAADWERIKTVFAILALRRRGLTMLKAKRAIEAAMEAGKVVLTVPVVESVSALAKELDEFGFTTLRLTPRAVDVRQLRERLGLSQEQFALRFGFDVAAVRNWEYGRREPDTAAKSYLSVIDRDPAMVEEALASPVL